MATRLPTSVTAAGQRIVAPVGIASSAVSQATVADTAKLARTLTQMQASIASASLPSRMSPRSTGVTIKNLSVPATGTLTVRHNLGRQASWSVVRWIGTAAPALWEVAGTATANSVTFGSSVAGSADIEFF